MRVRVGRTMRREVGALVREDRERSKSRESHDGKSHAPVERGGEAVAHDRREGIAQAAADAVGRVRVAKPARRHVRIENREVARVEHTVADAHEHDDREHPVHVRREPREDGASREEREAAEEHRARAEAVDREARDELRGAARRVEDADEQAQQGPRSVEIGTQQRKERWQRELEEVRESVGAADETDDADVSAERLGLCVIQSEAGACNRAGM